MSCSACTLLPEVDVKPEAFWWDWRSQCGDWAVNWTSISLQGSAQRHPGASVPWLRDLPLLCLFSFRKVTDASNVTVVNFSSFHGKVAADFSVASTWDFHQTLSRPLPAFQTCFLGKRSAGVLTATFLPSRKDPLWVCFSALIL